MKKINLRGLQEKLSAKELKNVLGGSSGEGEAGCECYVKSSGEGCEKTCCAPQWENGTIVSKTCKYHKLSFILGGSFCSCE